MMSDDIEVPDYRRVAGQWKDDFGNVLVIPDQNLSFLNGFPLRHAIVELEAIQQAKQALGLRHPGSSGIIREELHVEVSTFWFNPSSVRAVLPAIRTQASDRLMVHRSVLNHLKAAAKSVEPDIVELRPNFYGVGVNLRALWRRLHKSE